VSLLTICQEAAVASGFPKPNTIISNANGDAVQLLTLAKLEAEKISKVRNWSVLVKEGTITLVTSDQDYALPADFRWIVPQTTWDRTNQRIVLNPINGEEWQFLKAWTAVAGLNRRARIRAGQLEFEQTITSTDNGNTIAFEYLSTYWADIAATGTPKATFTLDDDIFRIDEHLLTLGLIWRFRRAKGLSFEDERAEYVAEVMQEKATDGGARRLNMGERSLYDLPNPNLPESGYG